MLRGVVVGWLAVLLGGCVYYLNPLCTDQIRNGDETDIDCGATCGPCDLGERCRSDADCDEGQCDGGRCAPLACANGVRDGLETDVDCGGGNCRACAGGRDCAVAADCFSGECVAATNQCFGLAIVELGAPVAYPSGQKTYALFAGDLDGDGAVDLAAANEQDSTISVFLNAGGGAFTRVPGAFPTGEYPTGGAIVDLDGDGVRDVVTADYHGDSVSVLRGLGGGMLAAPVTRPTVADSETSNLAVGDLDGDGRLDVVATNPLSSSVSVFRGEAGGGLSAAQDVPVGIAGGSTPYSVAIGDFNGDGVNDLAVADVRSARMIVRLGLGGGALGDEVSYAEGGSPPYIAIARDVDVDGVLDLVVANRGSDDVSVLIGRGDGAFRAAVVSPTGPMTGPYSIDVADFNLDGVPDVVTANFRSSTASLLLGLGDGRFEPPLSHGPMGDATYGIAAGDWDGDGVPDFATANANSNDITVVRNQSR